MQQVFPERWVLGQTDWERREVHYSGVVQGVGFRYTTRRIAAGLALTGFVRNLPDGRVQVVAEGPTRKLEELLAAIDQAMSGYIQDVRVEVAQATGQFDGFQITY